MLRQASTTLAIDSHGRGLHEITQDVTEWTARSGIQDGLLTLFVRHTSASLLIQENADADVRADLERFFARLALDGVGTWQGIYLWELNPMSTTDVCSLAGTAHASAPSPALQPV